MVSKLSLFTYRNNNSNVLILIAECSSELNKDNENSSVDYYPIFNRDAAKPKQSKSLFNSINNANKKWKTIGDRQYQIDAGQKEFGIKTCPQCEMQYSAHEPEDEILHEKYHKAINILSFKVRYILFFIANCAYSVLMYNFSI